MALEQIELGVGNAAHFGPEAVVVVRVVPLLGCHEHAAEEQAMNVEPRQSVPFCLPEKPVHVDEREAETARRARAVLAHALSVVSERDLWPPLCVES